MNIFNKRNFTFKELDFVMSDTLGFDLTYAEEDEFYIEYTKENTIFSFWKPNIEIDLWEMEFESDLNIGKLSRDIRIRSVEYKKVKLADIFTVVKFLDDMRDNYVQQKN